jgi:hypothetical protein
MSFSASTCLTNSGTIPLGGLFEIYSDVDQFFDAFQSNVTYSQLFNNCPYIMGNVPDGTTIIKIIDTLSKCCVTIDILSNDLCVTCDLEFDTYESTNIGQIVAGNLTGNCDNQISDYQIYWYGPNSTTELAFTSGFGDNLTYQYEHPLTGTKAVIQPSGVYTPVINQVNLNGLNFSQTGDAGVIQAEMDCLSPITVTSYNCSNGNLTNNDYTHRINFTGAGVGVTPDSLSTTFDLDPTTDYFAWKFNGFAVSDSLKITFSGSSYDEPLILEYWTIGTGSTLTSNISLLTIPKTGRTDFNTTPDPSYFFKVTSLTSLTINPGDYLILEVIPNQSNSQTNWDFYFTCLDSFDCSLCLDSYLNTPYKIKTTSIQNTAFGGCGQRNITFDLSGCSFSQIYSSDLWKYSMGATSVAVNQFVNINTNNTTNLLQRQTTVSTGTTSCGLSAIFNTNLVCAEPPNNNTIIFQKTIVSGEGKINMVFSDLNDLIVYKNSYESIKATSGYNPDPTNINYYQYIILAIQSSTGNQPCGDTTTTTFYNIHYSSVITTGGTIGNWSLTMPMPTITKQINYTTCQQGCDATLNSVVNAINTSSTSTSNNLIRETNIGQRYTVPFYRAWKATLNTNNPTSGNTAQGYYLFYNSYNLTIPFSGNSSPYTPITSLSAQTCDFTTKGVTQNPGNQQFQYQIVYVYDYEIKLTNYPDLTSYTIKANPIVNGVRTATNYPDTVVTVVNGSIVGIPNPLYTF